MYWCPSPPSPRCMCMWLRPCESDHDFLPIAERLYQGHAAINSLVSFPVDTHDENGHPHGVTLRPTVAVFVCDMPSVIQTPEAGRRRSAIQSSGAARHSQSQ